MFLITTIDTEEDNWGQFNASSYSLGNLRKIPNVQALFDKYNIRPTYLITYPVATDPWAIDLFSNYLAQGKCEIGMHCHPWNTPPFEEELCDYNSMLCNLPDDLQYRKLECLKSTICKNFGVAPVSFRAGRWALGTGAAKAICDLGFKIDTSVTAYTDWSQWHGVDYRNVGPRAYRFSPRDIFKESHNGELLQVPATVGFIQRNFDICSRMSKVMDAPFMQKCRMRGILRRMRLLNKVELSPETSNSHDMIALAERMCASGFGFVNLFFHTTSLMQGLTPFVKSKTDELVIFKNLENFISFTYDIGMRSLTLSQLEKECKASV